MPKKVTPKGKAASTPKKAAAAPKRASTKKSKSTSTAAKGTRYVRSLYGSESRISLDNGLEIHLKPRGQVGDMAPVDAEDRADQKYALNKDLLFEEISQAEHQSVIEKQNTNAQAPRPTTMDLLRTPNDQPYQQQAPIMEIPYEQQGTVVANIETDQTKQVRHQEQISRPADGSAPQQVAVPGSVQNPGPQVPSHIPPEQAADWLARNSTSEEGAADQLRGSLRTSIGPTERAIDVTPRNPVHPDDVGR